ncbi:MBL fold metallo-hydrolase [Streptomyces kaniharaensis]|uniref:MBL fold metallo-hydrolase n=1 Tax=Streptomyces kaniharaensis TaxID=212423 RepID=A0A6N7L280_9ACTN|nr:MBL fold metallo-hydrolase [Streptomyces kaniharaensis]MQS16827.1 MBL fold metallo-hydrolase [Streptomyces kaniharaensis]
MSPLRKSRQDGPAARRLSRRHLLAASATGTATLAGAAALIGASSGTTTPQVAGGPRRRLGPPGSSGVQLRWLGNNGWEISFGDPDKPTTILIDPWITRFRTGTYTPQGADPATPITVDTGLIDSLRLRAAQILVTHGHYDHLPDIPYIAARTGATVLGTETHANLLTALGAPKDQLSVVRGGEYLQFDGYTIQVLNSLHSMTGPRQKVPFPGTRPGSPPPRPQVISDLVEGGTLAYLITIGDRLSILDNGGANYDARQLAGLAPDVLLVQPGGASVPDYVPRLLDVLDHPPYVIPTHWDDFDHALTEPARDWGGLTALETAVRQASPSARFIRLDHLESFTP